VSIFLSSASSLLGELLIQNKFTSCTTLRIPGKYRTFFAFITFLKCSHSDVFRDDYFSVCADGIDQEGIKKLE